MSNVGSFGEIMLRISPWDKSDRLFQTKVFRIEPAGSESNVAINLRNLGIDSIFLTSIPKSDIGVRIIRYLKGYGINTSFVTQKEDSRLGLFWNENGVDIRASSVIYDRENSAFSCTKFDEYNWIEIVKSIDWFHTSGITPALTENTYNTLMQIINKMVKNKISISIDLNYRSKLWKWVSGKKKSEIPKLMKAICSEAKILIGNEDDFQVSLGVEYEGETKDQIEKYGFIADRVFDLMPQLQYIAISLRNSISASINNWSGLLLVKRGTKIETFKANDYKLTNIVDRVGAGDSFCAGIIYGLLSHSHDFQYVIDFATTFSALKHTVRGDISEFSVEDVRKTMETKGFGRIIR